MIHARINKERAVPWWAAVLAPVVGVPAMVALLALAGPDKAAPVGELESGVATEQVETKAVDQTLERRAEQTEPALETCHATVG